MKTVVFSPDVYRKLRLLRRKDRKLFNKIQKQLVLFHQNPRHKSLRLHKLTRGVENTWSVSIDRNIRMLYVENEDIYFFDLGTHDEVYKK